MDDLFLDTETEDVDFYGEDMDDYGYYDEEPEETEEIGGWSDELETFDIGEDYVPDDYIGESLADYDLDMFDDSAELAEALREVLHEDYGDATPEEMQEALFNVLGTMTPAEGFNFKKALRQISKAGRKVLRDPTVGKIAGTVLPAAGATIGTFFGGPIGTAIGGKLGQAAGQAFSRGRRPRSTSIRSKRAKASPQGGSAAAAQLLQLTQNPDMLKSLLALALGSHGRKSIRVGKSGPSVPTGGFMNLLGTLVNEAAADADELLRESDETSAYLRDSEGEFLVDPAVPEDRAQVLYETLLDAENQQLVDDIGEDYAWDAYYDPELAEARYSYKYYRPMPLSRRLHRRALYGYGWRYPHLPRRAYQRSFYFPPY